MKSRLILKEALLSEIKTLAHKRNINPQYPITDLMLSPSESDYVEKITNNLETYNPFPKLLLYGVNLLDGIWQLHYSTAREIRSLNQLPFGFKLKQVYQIIDTQKASFFNIAFVKDSTGLISGYVKVTATFSPKIAENEVLPNDIINVNFEKRYISIKKILGIKTSIFDPIKVFNARNPQGRIPSLKVTYIDESLRIGRGGDGSLFILSKQKSMVND
ncbi:PAP/fibrillin family protein [Geminocystis sp. NIES-3709]|uniref:PAP/fibrillin family protein n=1 Tax=Geminocystis sp. NIES-3709 TaxID=1617448 RepID=UPI0005FC6E51|nr:PAP/fibrillin family protein [Geminocystis sp. NIES-3709]BAQ64689.1 fibrillin [Geminocystis sp. NIES-3709]